MAVVEAVEAAAGRLFRLRLEFDVYLIGSRAIAGLFLVL